MSLYEYGRMTDIGHLGCCCCMSSYWSHLGDLSSFPERYLLIEYPLVEREESVFAFSSKKLLLSLRQTKRLASTPTDIEKLSTIKMNLLVSLRWLAFNLGTPEMKTLR